MTAIWKKHFDIETMNASKTANMCSHLGMTITKIGDDYLCGTLPVDERTRQPMGLLHGGASVALAETLGSLAGNLACDNNQYCVGVEINANHLRAVSSGLVTGTARALHLGRSTQVWEIRIEDEQQRLTCISRLTLAVKTTG
ncbi:hotdog fold thioesterase [Endozoicomonas sp. Mp262]|uniref:hotdog fold thioesterase n=1 Tax=Endozoicomonas sp. Mp262 TaxID=2919499 RepID=UPI0021D96768